MRVFKSYFKTKEARQALVDWQSQQLAASSSDFQVEMVKSKLGDTQVISTQKDSTDLPALIILPGFRTCSLLWDLCDNIQLYKDKYRVFMVDVVGQPTLSSGLSPKIKGSDYGVWLADLMDKLSLPQAAVAGASFGGQLLVKLAGVAADRISLAFLCNPAGIIGLSFNWPALYENIRAMLAPSDKNIERMMQKVALGSTHNLQHQEYQAMLDYLCLSIKGFVNKAQFPYKMGTKELAKLKAPTHLLLGTDDLMFNYQQLNSRAEKTLPNLQETHVFEGIGHGIEVEKEMHHKIIEMMDGHYSK